ncbi:sensor histidine kinase [Pseudoluteimonas lycopersici]|uniref:Sensor histidine kinase n=1 Tax=Pseudoluteimonas lycopersici TaxID=1324796 RepID=A0A516V4K6_9GAMM|nr:histidine kinase [Lysobacter lycopersici]QDQ73407.1 sensor histidine kinase [Lysobacter lycopersici]
MAETLLTGWRQVDTKGNSSLDALFRPYALIAVLLAGESLALLLALASGTPGGRLTLFGLASLGVQWVALGTLCTLFLLRRPLARLPSPAVAWICLIILLGMTLLVGSAAWGMLDASAKPLEGKASFVLRMLAIALVVGVLMLLTYQNYWRARQLAVRAKQLELEALQARIRPHFLFNTLNTAIALVHARPDEAERVLLDLTDLFRNALSGSPQVLLADELALTRRYLEIEALRFGERVQIHWRLPDALPDVSVPSLSIQPLAENAIRHGIEPRPGGGRIDISVNVLDRMIEVVIANDMLANGRRSDGHAIGLKSARERVMAMTGGHGQVESRIEDGRYLAIMSLPRG